MKLLAVALLELVGYSVGLQFSMKSSNLIREHGIEYSQVLSYDPQAEVMKIEVPAHLNIDASVSIFDNKQNLQVVYTPRHKLCQIDEVPKELDIKEMMKFSVDAQFNGEVFGHGTAKDVYEMDIYTPVSDEEIRKLPQYIQELCEGSTVNRVRSIRVSEDDFYNSSLHLYPHQPISTHPRVKRQFLPICRETGDLCTTNANWGYRCRWLLIRAENAPANVKEIYHGRSSKFSCVMCCIPSGGSRYSATSGMCKCDKVRTKSDFQGCYPTSGHRVTT